MEGITGGVCLGALPLRRFGEGRYFEVQITEWTTSLKCMAIGVAARQNEEEILRAGNICVEEARELQRVWLAGYEARGAQFINDQETAAIPESSWRPAKHLRPNSEQTPIR